MKEKKKQQRPTWAMVRALEAEIQQLKGQTIEELQQKLDSQIEGTSRLVKDCDIWRENFRELKAKNATLEKSNTLMEEEIKTLKERIEKREERIKQLAFDYERLKSRSLWQRILNR